MNKPISYYFLWGAYVLVLLASLRHVAWAFGMLEFAGAEFWGWSGAVAVDLGLAALAYAIQQRKLAKRGTAVLWAGVLVFAGLSGLANLWHALAVVAGNGDQVVLLRDLAGVDVLRLVPAVALSATLPLLVVYLGEVVSSDDAAALKAADAEQRRLERERIKAERAALADALATAVPDDPDAALLLFFSKFPTATQAQASTWLKQNGHDLSRSWVGGRLRDLADNGRIRRNGSGVEIVEEVSNG